MKYALATTILAALVCVGCTQKTEPVATGEPTLEPSGMPGRTIEPMTPAPDVLPPEPATDLVSLAPEETLMPTPMAPAYAAPAPGTTRVLPPPPAPTPAPAATGGTYTIKKGDTFIKIAREVYGNASRMHAIQAANPGVDPRKLKIGQVINLPDVTSR